MRILIVYNTAMEPRSISGVQRHFAGVVKHWIAAGHQVDFALAAAAHPLWRRMFPHSQLLSTDSLIPAPGRIPQAFWCAPAYAWRMFPFHYPRTARTGYDVIYPCAPFFFEVYPAWRLAQANRAALVVKIHHLVTGLPGRTGIIDRLFLQSERASVRLLHRHGNLILGSTPAIAKAYTHLESSLGLNPSPMVCTGYGIDLDDIPFLPDSPKEFDAVVLGRLHEHKGVLDIPELWTAVRQRHPSARLLVIGEGPHRDELQRRLRSAGLEQAVQLTGAVDDLEKNRLLSRCRLGLSLSREEGWGLSITEFLAAGLPVVALQLPVFPEVFGDQLDTVPLGDLTGFAQKVCNWLDDPARCREQGAEGRRFVARYDYRSVAAAELAAIQQARNRSLDPGHRS
jgi:glycosyltransferase involved in cell wall biosynthesis